MLPRSNDIVVDPLDRIVAVGDMAVFGGFRVLAAVRYVDRGVRNAREVISVAG